MPGKIFGPKMEEVKGAGKNSTVRNFIISTHRHIQYYLGNEMKANKMQGSCQEPEGKNHLEDL